jgi:hypothetical protein
MGIGEVEGFAIEAGELKFRGGIGVANETDGGLLVLGSSKNRREKWKPGDKEAGK